MRPTHRAPALQPEDCAEIGEVRAAIDALDGRLVSLLAERQRYIEAAARIKKSPKEVRLEWRIKEVLHNVRAQSEHAGLSWRIAEPVWRVLMDRSIEHEHEHWRLFHIRNDEGNRG